MSERLDWDQVWSRFAKVVSGRSTDPKHKVAAIIVSDDNTQVLSIGYNGDEKGGTNQRVSLEKGSSGFIHAEINALIKCDFNNHKDKKMYLTLSPCIMCAKAIINAGIKEVIYNEIYDDDSLDLLRASGIKVRFFNE